MATASENLVIGYYPGVTRATGLRTAPGKTDVLQKWIKKAAERTGNPEAVELAAKYPNDFLDIFLRKRGVVFTLIGGELSVYSMFAKPNIPPQVVKVLVDRGIDKSTPIGWYRHPDSDGEPTSAGEIVPSLPDRPISGGTATEPLTELESLVVEIVDELIG